MIFPAVSPLRRLLAATMHVITGSLLSIRDTDELIGGEPERFDAIEIHGVRQFPDVVDPTQFYCEVDSDDPEFFSVCLHCVDGGVTCCADLPSHRRALRYARAIARRYGWPVYDFRTTPPRSKDRHHNGHRRTP